MTSEEMGVSVGECRFESAPELKDCLERAKKELSGLQCGEVAIALCGLAQFFAGEEVTLAGHQMKSYSPDQDARVMVSFLSRALRR